MLYVPLAAVTSDRLVAKPESSPAIPTVTPSTGPPVTLSVTVPLTVLQVTTAQIRRECEVLDRVHVATAER